MYTHFSFRNTFATTSFTTTLRQLLMDILNIHIESYRFFYFSSFVFEFGVLVIVSMPALYPTGSSSCPLGVCFGFKVLGCLDRP